MKYHNKKIECDGILFDSKKECQRYCELKLLEKAGEIEDLERQKRYLLIPEQREEDTIGPKGGIKKGKLIERACYYTADFVYKDVRTGETVVEDTKGFRTKEYLLKRKLMLFLHNIRVLET